MEASRIDHFNNHKMKDSEVIRRILSGEKELFEILLRRNNQKLYRVVRSYLKDESEVEDIMQNSYLKSYEKLAQFKHTSTYATWLIRIAINESLARLKEKGKIYQLYDHSAPSKNNAMLDVPDPNQLNPERKIIRQEAKQFLENTIDSLEQKYRTVYVLKEVENMSMAEIAECLDLSVSNVKVRLHRAKKMLKEALYKHTQSEEVFGFGHSRCDRITTNVMRSIL